MPFRMLLFTNLKRKKIHFKKCFFITSCIKYFGSFTYNIFWWPLYENCNSKFIMIYCLFWNVFFHGALHRGGWGRGRLWPTPWGIRALYIATVVVTQCCCIISSYVMRRSSLLKSSWDTPALIGRLDSFALNNHRQCPIKGFVFLSHYCIYKRFA